ncbi:MAG: sugar ABC transporter permease [Caldilinea sp.]|nr:sugar ABC transporter permease [Caldilinea sp.]MCB0148512.1 sugar ABC transporter permease [Caldilineaceae bacterium]MCB0048529.1 sugar ABC transporter permease [Caldilinea sp.]MCB9114062.1 sugar ABC transporter permease [Caldilineaceae bacterium]MCB9118452.1 sugar ABC transporter permease [Caldilineaceae bacterium]
MAVRQATELQNAAAERRLSSSKSLWQRMWAARWCYLFMLPALILSALFTFYPIVMSWYYSLFQWSGFTADKTFIGLSNYLEVISDKYFWDAFVRSFLFMLVSMPIKLTLALLIAIVLNDQAMRVMSPAFRTMFFLPVVTTAAIIGIMMTFVLSPFNGPINKTLMTLGMISGPIDFLGNPRLALWTVVGVEIWKWLGQPMIYWLAALQVIPQSLYEAAKVDGANWWRQLLHITLPLLIPFAIVIVLITAVSTLRVFPLVQTMTGGGPFFATEVMEVYIYRTAFGSDMGGIGVPRLGYASAAGVVFGVSIMALALLQAWGVRNMRDVRSAMETSGE